MKGRSELERAEYQYQNILMGQGYKRGAFDQAPENIREMARITAVSPVVEKSGMIHLEATLTPHPHLMPGMSAIVTLGGAE